MAVHTVCQHVFWERLLPLWESLAVGAIPVVIVEDWVWPMVHGYGRHAAWIRSLRAELL